jgi:plasmid maintenance system antidote protein VapI
MKKTYSPQKAIELAIDMGITKYRIAKVMDVQPILIDKLLKEEQKTIRREAADRLLAAFDIEIHDNYINGYQKQMFINKFNELDHN